MNPMSTTIVKMGEKGQITIPSEIREKEHLGKGEFLEIVDLSEGNILITKLSKKHEFMAALKILGRGLKSHGYSTDQKIIELCREIRKEVYDESIGRH